MKDSTISKYKLIVDEWLVNGRNGTKAYQKFTPNSSDENAANRFLEIMRISEIIQYAEDKRQKKAEELNITLDKQIERLNTIIDSEEARENDKINAIKEQNKLLALYEEHNRQKGTLSVNERANINFKNKR
tara:strand:- start:102 stop:494 length:393 start_codon:yes stop_codon:yes gene_type:complete